MKKIGKISFTILLLLICALTLVYFSVSMSLPEGKTGKEADLLASKMLESLGYENYISLNELSWTFRGLNSHQWNRDSRQVRSQFGGNEVLLDFKTGQHRIIKNAGVAQDQELIAEAIANFYNDSFWLVAPFKIMDKGTERKSVETDDGHGLLITYNSGGLTPGDSYLWVLDENHRPKYWRIWTSNVPIPGMKFQWDDWKDYEGAMFSTVHPSFGPLSIDITDLKVK